jgi:hypothetical protein
MNEASEWVERLFESIVREFEEWLHHHRGHKPLVVQIPIAICGITTKE